MRDSLNLTTWMNKKKNEQESFSYLLHYFEMFDGLGNMCNFLGSQSNFSRNSLNLTHVFHLNILIQGIS
jgi:hypothetical protein